MSDVFEELLKKVRADPLHRFSIDRAHRRLPNPINRKDRYLDRAVAVMKLEASERLDLIATALETSFIGPVANSELSEFHRDCLGAISKNMQVDRRVFVRSTHQHRANESWRKTGE